MFIIMDGLLIGKNNGLNCISILRPSVDSSDLVDGINIMKF